MKRILLTVGLLLLPTIVSAQELNLKLSLPETEVVWKALRKLPVEEVDVVMAKIRQQVTEQTTPKVEAAPEDKNRWQGAK